jgi:hypothetical protein
MTGALAWNSKLATRFAPFLSVRKNPSAGARICQQMRQLVAQGSINFGGTKLLQCGVKQDEGALEIGTTDGGPHTIVPIDPQTSRQVFCVEATQEASGSFL